MPSNPFNAIVPARAGWPDQPLVADTPEGVTIRPAVPGDEGFVDLMQKSFKGNLGFLYSGTIQRKIEAGLVLVAVDRAGAWLGFVMGSHGYDRNDAVSRIDQIAVVAARQRRQLGSALLRRWVEGLPYGVTLLCCWCAQDLRENRFWEAEGFIPLAFRAGGQSSNRVHIFWQRRTRRGDVKTPFWYPKETSNGAMSAARLILPIPPGTDWREVDLPRVMPQGENADADRLLGGPVTPAMLTGNVRARDEATPKLAAQRKTLTAAEYQAKQRQRAKHLQPRGPVSPAVRGRQHEQPERAQQPAPVEKKRRAKNIPEHVAAARELRDRWLEQLNEQTIREGGKYDPSREIDQTPTAAGQLASAMMHKLTGGGNRDDADTPRLIGQAPPPTETQSGAD